MPPAAAQDRALLRHRLRRRTGKIGLSRCRRRVTGSALHGSVSHARPMLAAEIWHWWIGVILLVVGVLAVVGSSAVPEERHGAELPEHAPTPTSDVSAARAARRAARPLLVPAPGTPVDLRILGRRRFDRTRWRSPSPPAATSTPCTSTTACGRRSARRGRARRGARPTRSACRCDVDRVDVGRRTEPRGPGPRRPPAALRPAR